MSLWSILEKDETGVTYRLWIGPPGVPGSKKVDGITDAIARELGSALLELEKRAEYRALERVRDAIGVPTRYAR